MALLPAVAAAYIGTNQVSTGFDAITIGVPHSAALIVRLTRRVDLNAMQHLRVLREGH